MTRTARATYPRAALKDRSQSRSGMDKSLKKNGSGRGNWGKLGEYEDVEYNDDEEEEAAEILSTSEEGSEVSSTSEPKQFVLSEKDVEAARAFRKRALSGTVDLSGIARTSVAVSGSPPKA